MLERYFNCEFKILRENKTIGAGLFATDTKIEIQDDLILFEGVITRKSGNKKYIQDKKEIESSHELQFLDDQVFEIEDLIEVSGNTKFNGTYIIVDIDENAADSNDFQVLSLNKQGTKNIG